MNFIQRFFCDYFGWWCPPKTRKRLSSSPRRSPRRSRRSRSSSPYEIININTDDFDEEINFNNNKSYKKNKKDILDKLTDVVQEYRGKGGKRRKTRRKSKTIKRRI
jgi:hypothetical protein